LASNVGIDFAVFGFITGKIPFLKRVIMRGFGQKNLMLVFSTILTLIGQAQNSPKVLPFSEKHQFGTVYA